MELGVRFLIFLQTLLRGITLPVYWLWSRQKTLRLPATISQHLQCSASRLAAAIRKGEVKSEDVVNAFIARIVEVNDHLNAVVDQRFSLAVEEARAVDKLVASGLKTASQLEEETPLLGVPITIKESCRLKGLSYCVGSQIRSGLKADADGTSVSLLKAAGAIPLLVSTTPELCLSWETNNLVNGRTLNPYSPLRTCGGSSGGEGALLGAGASVIGLGSDIAGSIRVPAMFNGVFGHKPTPGYVPLEGHYPISHDTEFLSYLVIGPLTRYAEDLRPMLKVLAGGSGRRLRLDDKVDIHNLKVFYMEKACSSLINLQTDVEISDRLRQAVEHLHKKFSVPVHKDTFKELEESVEISCSVFFGMRDIPNLLEDPSNPKETGNVLLEMVKSLLGMSRFSMNGLGFCWLRSVNAFIPRHKFKEYVAKRDALLTKFVGTLGHDGVFLYPTYPIPAFYHNQVYMATEGVLYTMIFNVLGMPSTHVPLGLNKEGIPIGIQVAAAPHNDRLCLTVAEELERAFGGWVPPSRHKS